MLKTKNIIADISQVPREWVYEFYLRLNEKLMGQTVMILSPFNPSDKRPSFALYTDKNNVYKYKDFSTGQQGDNILFVQTLFSLSSRGEAAHKIIEDYTKWLTTGGDAIDDTDKTVITRYKVTDFAKRKWDKLDEKFWTPFNIGSKLLEFYNVAPLDFYTMQRQVGDKVETVKARDRSCMYGYFRADGTLYKIYQPLMTNYKFFKVRDYIQGTDQLTYQKKYLVICSSLKDLMAFASLGYKEAEAVAPDSENTLIPEHVINAYRLKYKGIVTLFDVDQAGLSAMNNYETRYGIKGVRLLMSKDLSDSVRDNGVQRVLKELTPNLKLALK